MKGLGWYLASLGLAIGLCQAACFEDTTPWTHRLPLRDDVIPEDVFRTLAHRLDEVAIRPELLRVSFSTSVTNLNSTLWSYHHTARHGDIGRPGAHPVTADSYYRIASITKMFTTTAVLQLHAAGKLSLDDPVSKHLPKLSGPMSWDKVTVRSLVSQSSGLGRDWSQGDLTRGVENPLDKGFPPPTKKHLTPCYEQADFLVACNATDLYHAMPDQRPVFAPNQVGSYSNAGFELLGLVIEAVSGISYEEYVEKHILDAWALASGVTFDTPPDPVSVLPEDYSWFWGIDIGIHAAAGALYATSNGLDKYLRAMMQKAESAELGAPAVNIFMPESFSFGSSSSYGLTWEVFRTTKILDTDRPVTFFTKGGGHPGYSTMILAIPEYGLGITVLCAGDNAGKALTQVREVVTHDLIRAAERASVAELKRRYTGHFTFQNTLHDDDDSIIDESFKTPQQQKPIIINNLDSSLTIAHSLTAGLYIQSWTSNGSNMLSTLDSIFTPEDPGAYIYRLVATNLYLNDTTAAEDNGQQRRSGEIWRGVPMPKKKPDGIWTDVCVNDVDGLHFDGKPFLEFVFYDDDDDEMVVEVPSFRVRLRRRERSGGCGYDYGDDDEELYVQQRLWEERPVEIEELEELLGDQWFCGSDDDDDDMR